MSKKNLKLISCIMSVALIAGVFVGCGKKETSDNKGSGTESKVSGSITAAGSSALQPLAEMGAKEFMNKNAGVTINVQGGGSGTGLKLVSEGSVQIGNSDIFAKEKQGIDAAALVDHKICVAGFAVVVNENTKIDSLTKEQLIDVFTGKITNWKEVGGEDLAITLINRPKSSGTRATFKKYGLDNKDEANGMTQDSSGAVKQAIKQTKGSISYLALSYFADKANIEGMKVLKIDGIEPNKENITNDKYKIWSYEHMYTKGEPTGTTKSYLEFMTSDAFKPMIEKLGYIPVGDMKVSREE